MLPYDAEKTAQIWKRVQGQPAAVPDSSELLIMIAEEWADAVTYLHLSRHFQGRDSRVLREMAYQEQAHCACLKGIYTMITGDHPHVHVPGVSKGTPQQLLRQCYNRELQCITRYQVWADDPVHGVSFSRMAEQEQSHGHMLLQLIGKQRAKR